MKLSVSQESLGVNTVRIKLDDPTELTDFGQFGLVYYVGWFQFWSQS